MYKRKYGVCLKKCSKDDFEPGDIFEINKEYSNAVSITIRSRVSKYHNNTFNISISDYRSCTSPISFKYVFCFKENNTKSMTSCSIIELCTENLCSEDFLRLLSKVVSKLELLEKVYTNEHKLVAGITLTVVNELNDALKVKYNFKIKELIDITGDILNKTVEYCAKLKEEHNKDNLKEYTDDLKIIDSFYEYLKNKDIGK